MPDITILRPQDEADWNAFVSVHPEATSFHSLVWRDVFADVFAYKPRHLMARRCGAVTGVLPLFLLSTLTARQLVSVPFRDRGGILAQDAISAESLCREAIQMARQEKCRYLIIKSLTNCPIFDPHVAAGTCQLSRTWIRSHIDLPASREPYWKRLPASTRNQVRQGENAGFEFLPDVRGEKETEECIEIFRQTHKRLGIPPFPRDFYRRLLSGLRQTGEGSLSAVTKDREMAAAAIILHVKERSIYAYAGSIKKFWGRRVNDFLVWNCLVSAISRRSTIFDFGSDSEQQHSLLSFKKKWMAVQSPMNYYFHSTAGAVSAAVSGYHDSSRGIYPWMRGLMRRLPEPLYGLSANFTRYFG